MNITEEEKDELLFYLDLCEKAKKKTSRIKGLSKVTYFDVDNVEGFTAIKDDALLVVFRSSEDFEFQLEDNDWIKTNLLYSKVRDINNISIHRGFSIAWNKVRDLVMNTIISYDKPRVIFVGASMGGAIAEVASLDLKYQSKHVECATFGKPRVGGFKFRRKFNKLVNKSRRVVYGSDPVPHLPFILTPSFFVGGIVFPRLLIYLHTKGKIKFPYVEKKRSLGEFLKTFWKDHFISSYKEGISKS